MHRIPPPAALPVKPLYIVLDRAEAGSMQRGVIHFVIRVPKWFLGARLALQRTAPMPPNM
jgi:hypothetical protein